MQLRLQFFRSLFLLSAISFLAGKDAAFIRAKANPVDKSSKHIFPRLNAFITFV
jgi:hypothetical protein